MIYFTGDLFLGNDIIHVDPEALEVLDKDGNIIVVNLESVILKKPFSYTRKDKSAILYTTENAFLHFVKLFKNAQLHFNLGNNHLHDFGEEGIITTKEFLDNQGLNYFGFCSEAEDYSVQRINYQSIKISLISCSTSSLEVMSVTHSTDHSFRVKDFSEIGPELIASEKEVSDFVIILPHWGKEYISFPTLECLNLGKKWIESQADFVIGSHPHVIQGGLDNTIFYSLGNFYFTNFKKKNGIWHLWTKKSRRNIVIELRLENGLLTAQASGWSYSNKVINPSSKALTNFLDVTQELGSNSLYEKNYYGFYEEEYYKHLRAVKNKKSKIKHLGIQLGIKIYERLTKKEK